MNDYEVKTCYDCGKKITETDKPYYEDTDLCKECYLDKEDEEGK